MLVCGAALLRKTMMAADATSHRSLCRNDLRVHASLGHTCHYGGWLRPHLERKAVDPHEEAEKH